MQLSPHPVDDGNISDRGSKLIHGRSISASLQYCGMSSNLQDSPCKKRLLKDERLAERDASALPCSSVGTGPQNAQSACPKSLLCTTTKFRSSQSIVVCSSIRATVYRQINNTICMLCRISGYTSSRKRYHHHPLYLASWTNKRTPEHTEVLSLVVTVHM